MGVDFFDAPHARNVFQHGRELLFQVMAGDGIHELVGRFQENGESGFRDDHRDGGARDRIGQGHADQGQKDAGAHAERGEDVVAVIPGESADGEAWVARPALRAWIIRRILTATVPAAIHRVNDLTATAPTFPR